MKTIKAFSIGDKVKLTDELLHYSANKHWIGKRGTVIKSMGEGYVLVKWEHLNRLMEQPTDYIELAFDRPYGL